MHSQALVVVKNRLLTEWRQSVNDRPDKETAIAQQPVDTRPIDSFLRSLIFTITHNVNNHLTVSLFNQWWTIFQQKSKKFYFYLLLIF